jgi:hypothetical protein
MKRLAWLPLLLLLVACRPDPLLLNDFETEADLDRLTWRCPYWIEATQDLVTSGAHGLLVEFPPETYPTLELREVPADWAGYAFFEADLSAPNAAGEEMFIRIDDAGDSEAFADRFTYTVPLTGKAQHVKIPLERIAAGNGGRPLDLSEMDRILFFMKSTDRRLTWFLDGVKLTR